MRPRRSCRRCLSGAEEFGELVIKSLPGGNVLRLKEVADAAAQRLINNLGGTATSTNGSYVNVKVDTSKGQVSGVTVSETKSLTDAIGKANSAMQSATILGHQISDGGEVTAEQAKTALGLGSAAYKNSTECDAAWFLFLRIALAILGLLWFHINVWLSVIVMLLLQK